MQPQVAEVALKAQRADLAIEEAATALKREKDCVLAFTLWGEGLLAQGRADEAMQVPH